MIRPVHLVGVGAVVVVTAIALNFVILEGGDEPAPIQRPAPEVAARAAPLPTPTPRPQPKPRAAEREASGPVERSRKTADAAAQGSGRRAEKPTPQRIEKAAPKKAKIARRASPRQAVEKPAKPAEIAPSFDVVRINAEGDTVIAGRGKPGARILIFDGGKKIGQVTADGRGEWVFIPPAPLPSGNRRLSLSMIMADGGAVPSASVVMLMVPKRGRDLAGRPSEKPSQPLVMKVDRAGGKTQEVLQKPSPQASPAELLVDAVDYDDAGRLHILGHAPPGSRVRVYLDNHFLGEARVEGSGAWRLAPANLVSPGIYQLRADRVNKAGTVLARSEIVFARSVPLRGVRPGTLVVIEPGNSLWRIARRTYGSGFRYTVIYEANKAQIRDANLIYPGQVFKLPAVN